MDPDDETTPASHAQRKVPSAAWDDLELSDESLQQLRDIAQGATDERRPSDRGLDGDPRSGVIALFTGDSGAGKWAAAHVLATHLGTELLTVDVAAVVSKYIGETEKNLHQLFARAEESAWILFFDEADALFGERTNVMDSHDRYREKEVDYLLQRIEAYPGLVILAINTPHEPELAVLRRLAVEVRFPSR
jgi:SpoVK/Ycf46/Vps4 family AAA+-type ATPase